jgi:hypothetical protein
MAEQSKGGSATNVGKRKQLKPPPPIEDVARLFEKHLRNGRRPTVSECSWLRNDIAVVVNSPPPKVLNADPRYRRRRNTISAIERLIKQQLAKLERTPADPLYGLTWQTELDDKAKLVALQNELRRARSALLAPFDHWAGEREGGSWHKPARFLANRVRLTMLQIGRKRVSFDKGGPLVQVVIGAMVMAGLPRQAPETVAAALAKHSTN